MQVYLILAAGVGLILTTVCILAYPYFKGGVTGLQAQTLRKNPPVEHNRDDAFAKMAKAEAEAAGLKTTNSELTLDKKLRYARWKMSKRTFWLSKLLISAIAFTIVSMKFNLAFQMLSVFSGHLAMEFALMRSVNKRFKKFDRDYPQFLLQLVGLLKTGMNPLQAIGATSEALEADSLVRIEAEIMLERLRLGVDEEKSIGGFGEDVNHPEIELFVQALLLSRRVGGTLSDTLDRLARQVRRRQYFREQANAAVGLQRGSIWFILAILCSLEMYIYFVMPAFVVDAINDPTGWQVWQFGIMMILGGVYWIRQVTKIRV